MKQAGTIGMLALAAGLVAGCRGDHPATGAPLPGGGRAMAMLHDAAGREVGRATVTEVGGGLRVTADLHGLPPGTHGIHVHAVGACDAPAFTTAGGHWNPTMRQHGSMNPNGQHGGDLPNLMVGSDGRGTVGAVIPAATLAGLMDADGAAIVVHAGPDDLMTDPAGNSGGRIACGVFVGG
jgi:Cu-Zn family superoxide dismutase